MANGIAMRALQLATDFASTRWQFGQPIRDFQAIRLLLGQMDAELEASRRTTYWAAREKDAGRDLRRAASIAKYVATEACFRVVDMAVQVHGGAGVMRIRDRTSLPRLPHTTDLRGHIPGPAHHHRSRTPGPLRAHGDVSRLIHPPHSENH